MDVYLPFFFFTLWVCVYLTFQRFSLYLEIDECLLNGLFDEGLDFCWDNHILFLGITFCTLTKVYLNIKTEIYV